MKCRKLVGFASPFVATGDPFVAQIKLYDIPAMNRLVSEVMSRFMCERAAKLLL
jgi:hypothetical protein